MLPRKRNSADKNGSIRRQSHTPNFSSTLDICSAFGLIERNPLMISRALLCWVIVTVCIIRWVVLECARADDSRTARI